MSRRKKAELGRNLDPETLRAVAAYMREHTSDVLLFAGGRATDVWVFLLELEAAKREQKPAA